LIGCAARALPATKVAALAATNALRVSLMRFSL
jgi:hypothetical protein